MSTTKKTAKKKVAAKRPPKIVEMIEIPKTELEELIEYASWAYDQATGREARNIDEFLQRMKLYVTGPMVKCAYCKTDWSEEDVLAYEFSFALDGVVVSKTGERALLHKKIFFCDDEHASEFFDQLTQKVEE